MDQKPQRFSKIQTFSFFFVRHHFEKKGEKNSRNFHKKMIVTAKAFNAVQNLNIKALLNCTEKEIRPFLLCMVRSVLIGRNFGENSKEFLLILVGSEIVNNLVALLQINYIEIESDIKKEQQLR